MPDRVPDRVAKTLSEIAKDESCNSCLTAMMDRASEFDSPLAAKLAGVALEPSARTRFDDALDSMWAANTIPKQTPEVVIGSGLHAAIYCAVRVTRGHPKPLVIEAKDRAGGVFAVSRSDTFFLNSRNRPGNLGTPGRAEALNYLPGAPVQPSDLSNDEYQPNSTLAFSIRASLAMYAKVVTGKRVMDVDSTSVTLDDGRVIQTARVIDATGLGEPNTPPEADGERLMTYLEFLSMLDKPFPLRGMGRVAVVGAGDAGRTVVEALVGQGPTAQLSVASLDWVEKIDWYGVPASCQYRTGWEENNRSRYKGLGRVLPLDAATPNRVNPITERANNVGVGFDGAYVDGARYDLVVWATGFEASDVTDAVEYKVGGRVVARMKDAGLFLVGPAAQITDGVEANVPSTVPENTAALFRYADRTAALAMAMPNLSLPAVEDGDAEPQPTRKPKVPKKKRQRIQRVSLDKSDPRNWAKGDQLRREDGVTAIVYDVSPNGVVYVTNESNGNVGPRDIVSSYWTNLSR